MKRILSSLALLFSGLYCIAQAQMLTIGVGPGGMGANGIPTLIQAITFASLTTNLKLALDAADSNSWPGSGTKWLDTSGGGYDFLLGSDGSTAAPTFTGSSGCLSSSCYWSFGGTQYFTYDTTNETWMENLHKDNAIYSIIAAIYQPNFSVVGTVIGDYGASITGFGHRIGSTELPGVFIRNASATVLNFSAGALSTSAWHIIGLSVNEAGGNVSFFYLDGAYNQVAASNTFDAAYSSPASGNATSTMQIAASGGANNIVGSGFRFGFLGMWEGTALSKANFDTLYAALKGRYGL